MKPAIINTFLVVPSGKQFKIYDIAGGLQTTAPTWAEAVRIINQRAAQTGKHRAAATVGKDEGTARKNPMTRGETRNLKAEARIHAKIKGSPTRRAYYQGEAAGMMDAAEQYGINPPNLKKISTAKLHEMKQKNFEESIPLTSALIDAGRGHELFQDTLKKSDPLSLKVRKNWERGRAITDEIEGRAHYGEKYYRSLSNPPLTEIYDEICEVVAKKGPGHLCDAACKRAGHTYRHVFTKKHKIMGTADGKQLIIK